MHGAEWCWRRRRRCRMLGRGRVQEMGMETQQQPFLWRKTHGGVVLGFNGLFEEE